LRRASILQNSLPAGAQLSAELVTRIKGTSNVDELVDEIVGAGLWTWIDVSLMDAMAAASAIPDALNLVRKYKAYAFSKYLHQIIPSIPFTINKEEYLREISCKINKSPNSLTVEDLMIHKRELEKVILDINQGSLTIAFIKEGCVEVHYSIPANLFIHAYYCSLKNKRKLHNLHVRYLHFEGHNKVYSMDCSYPHNIDSFPNIDQQGLLDTYSTGEHV